MFPAYVHSVLPKLPEADWLAQAQGLNECGCTTPANALNLLHNGERFFDKNQLVREAGVWFRRDWGGTPSFITEYLLRRHGAGTHFGNLSRTDGEKVLRALLDQGVPVCIEMGRNKIGPFNLYGEHAVLLVGYSEPFRVADGTQREEYYVIDAAFTDANGVFGLHTNNVDHDGDGVAESYPGNRTYERQEFLAGYPTGIYFPVFRSQAEHDRWYASRMRRGGRMPVLGWLRDRFITGSFDYSIV
ncbi:MAG TPA: hypothetical protein VD886_12740 [Herpetosiphonaceae bacterium]|nr:hypothetical protein [Herpetosiphonaceae bacterium]